MEPGVGELAETVIATPPRKLDRFPGETQAVVKRIPRADVEPQASDLSPPALLKS